MSQHNMLLLNMHKNTVILKDKNYGMDYRPTTIPSLRANWFVLKSVESLEGIGLTKE